MNRIMIPVDGSDGARHAVRFAVGLAREVGAELLLFHAYDPPGTSLLGLAGRSKEEVRKAEAGMAQASFDAVRAELTADVPVREIPDLGDPADRIIAAARENDVDLIVMGSRGLSPVKELLLGSVSEKVVHHAHCPVTVVR